MTLDLIVITTTFGAAFIHGVSGFGFALIAMPVLSGFTSIHVAAPLVALATLTNNTLLSIYYRQSFDLAIVTNLLLGSILGIPFGLLALRYVPEAWMLVTLGSVISAYAIYSLVRPHVKPISKSKAWAYGAGFLSGILNGSYNLPGPPIVVYGSSQLWPPEQFKGNLTAYFWANAMFAVIGHSAQHRYSESIIQQVAIAVPGLILGLSLGVLLSRLFDPAFFRKVINGILTAIGVRLVILGFQP